MEVRWQVSRQWKVLCLRGNLREEKLQCFFFFRFLILILIAFRFYIRPIKKKNLQLLHDFLYGETFSILVKTCTTPNPC